MAKPTTGRLTRPKARAFSSRKTPPRPNASTFELSPSPRQAKKSPKHAVAASDSNKGKRGRPTKASVPQKKPRLRSHASASVIQKPNARSLSSAKITELQHEQVFEQDDEVNPPEEQGLEDNQVDEDEAEGTKDRDEEEGTINNGKEGEDLRDMRNGQGDQNNHSYTGDNGNADGNTTPVEEDSEEDSEEESGVEGEEYEGWDSNDLRIWKEVAKKRNMFDKELKNNRMKLQTDEAKEMRRYIRNIKEWYSSMINKPPLDTMVTRRIWAKLDRRLKKLQADDSKGRGKRTFDIYAFIIPDLIRVLDLVFQARIKSFPEKERLNDLEDALGILGVTFRLCKSIRESKSKPHSENAFAVVLPTSRVFLPQLRALFESFRRKCASFKTWMETTRWEEGKEERQRQKEDDGKKQEEKDDDEIRERRRRGLEDLTTFKSRSVPRPIPERSQTVTKSSRQQWSEEENHELLMSLMRLVDVPSKSPCVPLVLLFLTLIFKQFRNDTLIVLQTLCYRTIFPNILRPRRRS